MTREKEVIVLGGGCFWCTEAIFNRIPGVTNVVSGYAGGDTDHAEVVRVEFDRMKISLEKILQVFFLAHDPTTLNRQGNDVGTQYRSIILFTKEEQKKIIENVLREEQKKLEKQIVTEVEPLVKFLKAEDYHMDYFNNNPSSSYCRFVIQPKLEKALKESEQVL